MPRVGIPTKWIEDPKDRPTSDFEKELPRNILSLVLSHVPFHIEY